MALNEEEVSLGTVTRKNRTWRTTVETPFGGMEKWSINVHREEVIHDAEGKLISRDATREVSRQFLAVAGESVTLVSDPTKTLTVAQIAEAIELTVDAWTQEDIAAETPEE